MRNQEIAKAMRLIAEGFTTLAVAFEGAENTISTPVEDVAKEVVKHVNNVTPLPIKETANEDAVVDNKEEEPKEVINSSAIPTEEELSAMTYNDLKALAKELKVKAVGTKKAIIENILALSEDTNEVVNEEPTKEVKETPEVVEDEGEVLEEVVEDEETSVDDVEVEAESLYDQVVADLEGYSDEELADILSEVGVSPKGKRQALLAKIVQAIEEGKLEWEAEETSDEEPESTEKEDPKEYDTVLEQEEFVGTEARRVACEKEMDRIEDDLEKGNISHKEIIKYLKDFYNGKYTSQGVEGDIDEYIAIQCDLIDDEGNKHELADPYYVGDDVFCCGQHLKELKDDLYCEICGTTYTM